MRQTLHLVNQHSIQDWRQPEGYRVKCEIKSWWRSRVARWCWRLLHKLNAVEQYGFYETVYSYGPAEQDAVGSMIERGILELIDQGRNVEDYSIVLGAQDFAELVKGFTPQDLITVPSSRLTFRGRGSYRAEFRGLPVHVVPNLSGLAILPKVIIEQKAEAA